MSYQGQTWVDEVALPLLKNCGELVVMQRVANHAGNGPTHMSGCFASVGTLAKLCLMGERTVTRHLGELKRRGLLIDGDGDLVKDLPADKRPNVYDLAGGHVAGCIGGHSINGDCINAAGCQIGSPLRNPRSAGSQFGTRQPSGERAGCQKRQKRGAKLAPKSSKEVNPSPLSGGGAPSEPAPAAPAEAEEEREEAAPKGNETPELATAALQVLAAYEEAKGGKAVNGTRKSILEAAEELLAGGRPLSWLIDRARELPQYGTDLLKHAEMSKVPFAVKATRKAPTAREALGLDDPAYVPVQRDMAALKAMIASKAGI